MLLWKYVFGKLLLDVVKTDETRIAVDTVVIS